MQTQEKKLLKRDRDAMALLRYEESCRSQDEFWRLADMYDKLDANAARRWRYWERLHYDALEDWNPVVAFAFARQLYRRRFRLSARAWRVDFE